MKGDPMRSKIIIYIIAALIILAVAYAAGLNRGQAQARQECIDKVAANCDYICGVGSDFYFPDKQGPDGRQDEYELVDDSLVAKKGGYVRHTERR
jgi:hypothetical protein